MTMKESEYIEAITIMADAMEKAATYWGPISYQISGDKTILAERALRALLEKFYVAVNES